jgi:hypothetical protein
MQPLSWEGTLISHILARDTTYGGMETLSMQEGPLGRAFALASFTSAVLG